MVKNRNPWLVLLFTIITFGIYGIFWIVFTTNEIIEKGGNAWSPWWLLTMLIPIANIVFMLIYVWKYCAGLEEVSNGSANKVLSFVLWIIFSPAAIIYIQYELNKLA